MGYTEYLPKFWIEKRRVDDSFNQEYRRLSKYKVNCLGQAEDPVQLDKLLKYMTKVTKQIPNTIYMTHDKYEAKHKHET